MYSWLFQISQTISGPVSTFLHSYEHSPIIIAILLGLIGALAPCQLTGNMSAITLFGNRAIQMDNNWREIIAFMSGKVVVYVSIGSLAWIFGQSFETKLIEYFPIFRKAMGPLLILTGLILLGMLKLRFLDSISSHIPMVLKKGKIGSFLLGAGFAMAFCPTMFVLFFVWLMPTVIATSYGIVLPAIFGVMTSLPLLIILWLIWYFGVRGHIMKKSMKLGRVIQKVAGVVLMVIGILDTITYW
ncbi:cytochrome C biosynthesis protein [Solibacillus sp. R5-41]|uniref:urease accessory protein UreH domain-containing protein n=1 Tax=Solibacillus sp. R5-41 TaxID=2048654 RepID=UPI000C12843C|nr:sulfite exporter TauE/SafE family protein [Solibacillus sp. R5-41]ATP41632.1 cytochrome C biosynthesis protein [Solibacillus sp. R5-41]